ncbi:hypothetical protein R1sor_000602 [Riccia sorocarpa]|uniref:Uncharacterized protein n=1 Tax=Riccia sorocarpa TaxID=122646 RepID=A0ABD3GWQ7_9MARC
MQLRPGPPHDWMEESATEGKSFVYLGVHTSSPINEKAIAEEIVKKMMKKLKHWSMRLLSWPAKTILLSHVLAATPLYQLLSVGLCRDGLDDLERLCRNFLWGWNEEGSPKQSLVAWERIAQSKENGGLGWTRFKDMADALNAGLVSRILEGGNAEWIQLAKSFILRTLRQGSYQRECSQWSVQEGLLLLPLTKAKGSPTLSRMLRSWHRVRRNLQRRNDGGELGMSLSMLQVVSMRNLGCHGGSGMPMQGQMLGILRRMRIENFQQAMEIRRREGWSRYLRRANIFPEEETLQQLLDLEEWSISQRVVAKGILELGGWKWANQEGEFKWRMSTRDWRQMVKHEVDFSEKMDEEWQRQSPVLQWSGRWKLLWSAPIAYRQKVAQNSPASLLICILHCWTVWRERNEWQFNHKIVNRPVHSLLKEVESEIITLGMQNRSEQGRKAIEQARSEISQWKDNWARRNELSK